MKKFLALGCCAVYLAFGSVAGAAHVHEASDHHDEMRGLHIDHAHVDVASGHEHAPSDDADHIEHHEGDALYLTVTAQRSIDPGPRVLPAMSVVCATIDTAMPVSKRRTGEPDPPRGPPGKGPTPPRAPPA